MKRFLFCILGAMMYAHGAFAMNEMAKIVRNCEGVYIADSDNYILKCVPGDEIRAVRDDGVRQFFVADNRGDVPGTFLDKIPDNADFIYVNVVKNVPGSRFEFQTCYRFILEKDITRDGYYASEVCEYPRPDYYL